METKVFYLENIPQLPSKLKYTLKQHYNEQTGYEANKVDCVMFF